MYILGLFIALVLGMYLGYQGTVWLISQDPIALKKAIEKWEIKNNQGVRDIALKALERRGDV